MDIGVPETEREIEIAPLEEPVPGPGPAPLEEPVPGPGPAPVEEPVEEPALT
jgi:hypothetical protein